MIQRALATLLCLTGAAAGALGIASATAWRADDILVARTEAAPGTTMLVTEPGVLDLAAETVTVRATADSRVVIALGRAEDVDAWVGGDAHTRVTGLAEWHVLATADVEAEPAPTAAPGDEAAAEPGTEPGAEAGADAGAEAAPAETPAAPADGATDGTTAEDGAEAAEPVVPMAPDPSGSDLWIAQVAADDEVEFEWTAREGRWSVLVAAVGEDAGPPAVSLAWPQVVTTPWLWPGVVVGSLLLLGGLAWWTRILLAGRRAARRPAVRPRAAAAAPTPADLPAPAPNAPTAPMTRRQLRELEEQRARGGRAARAGLGERFPGIVPGPGRTDTRGDDVPTRDTRGDVPTAAGAARTAPAPEGREARARWFGVRSGRRSEEAPGGPVVTPTVEPPAVPEEVVPAATPWTPAASADAWRRAWGLPAASDQPDQPAQPAQPGHVAPLAPPDRPGEPPLRRRRDNR